MALARLAGSMGLLGRLFGVVGFLLVVAAATGGYLYLTDTVVKATVTEKGSEGGRDYVVVTPKLAPFFGYRQELDTTAAAFVCEGYGVDFQVRSQAYRVFDLAGSLVYDSEKGLNDALTPVRCGAGAAPQSGPLGIV